MLRPEGLPKPSLRRSRSTRYFLTSSNEWPFLATLLSMSAKASLKNERARQVLMLRISPARVKTDRNVLSPFRMSTLSSRRRSRPKPSYCGGKHLGQP